MHYKAIENYHVKNVVLGKDFNLGVIGFFFHAFTFWAFFLPTYFINVSHMGTNKQGFLVNGVANIASNVVKNAISGKDTFISLKEPRNPPKLKLLCVIIRFLQHLKWSTRQQIDI
jgi:hypothetical protein